MLIFYNISIRGYAAVIWLASFFNPKAKLWIKGRTNWQKELAKNLKDKTNIHWFHCASLGEFEQGRPLIEKLKQQDSSITILVTFFSPSGFEIRKNYELADYVCYLPIDSKRNAKNFISNIAITKAFFIKYEFWYHYFTQLKKQNIPFYMVSSSFRENQIFFKWYGGWFRRILSLPSQIFVQDNHSQKLLNKFNINSIISGDTRFDKVYENSLKATPISLIEKLKKDNFLVIAGSSWQAEEEIIAELIKSIDIKLIIAPHDISKTHINSIQQLFPSAKKYSSINEGDITKTNILIIDSIGMLSNLYQYADVAIIGGGFTGALHNILEPATFGIPVLFGPSHEKFREAKKMILEGSGHEFNNSLELSSIIKKLQSNKGYLFSEKEKNKSFISKNIGATKIALDYINKNS